VASEWSTPEFDILIAMKRAFILATGVFFLYRSSLFLQAMPDFLLNAWPTLLGGQWARDAVAWQSEQHVVRDLK
jgi:hypothetical protein